MRFALHVRLLVVCLIALPALYHGMNCFSLRVLLRWIEVLSSHESYPSLGSFQKYGRLADIGITDRHLHETFSISLKSLQFTP